MRKLSLMLVVVLMLSAGCATKPEVNTVMPEAIPGGYFTPNGKPLSGEDFAELASEYDYVLLGEGHSVPCDHRVQAQSLGLLADQGMTPFVGLEMITRDKTDVVERFNAGQTSVEEFETLVDWEGQWGYDYRLYAPIIRVARERGMPLLALNVPRRVVKAVRDAGLDGVVKADRDLLPHTIIVPSGEQMESLEQEFDRHKDMMGEDRVNAELNRFVRVQSLWDTVMAENAMKAHRKTGRPVVIIVGSGHVEYNWGIGRRLNMLDPTAKVLNVVPWRGGQPHDPTMGDVFFYCKRTHTSRLGFSLEPVDDGAKVIGVAPDTRAEKAGFMVGDVIIEAQGMKVSDLWVLHKAAVKAAKAGELLRFRVKRDKGIVELHVKLTGVGGPADDGE